MKYSGRGEEAELIHDYIRAQSPNERITLEIRSRMREKASMSLLRQDNKEDFSLLPQMW